MRHFTDYFGITEVRGKNFAYRNMGRLHRRDDICPKTNTCAHLITAIVIKLLIYINSSHILTFSNFLPAIRDRGHYGHSADNDQRTFCNSE